MIVDKPIAQVTEAELVQMIANGEMEGKRIEYKRILELDAKAGSKGVEKDDPKRKFLASIASFANASGGDMFFGIEAKDGKPISITPMADFNSDAVKLRLQDFIRSHIQPRLFGIEFQEVSVEGGHVFVIRVPKSYNGPHMVTFGGDDHFYLRGTNGRTRMDLEEIRSAFTFSETVTERVRKWRMERIGNILADELPRTLVRPARIVLHVMPLSAFSGIFKTDVLSIIRETENLAPINAAYGLVNLDFDGAYSHNGSYENQMATAYTYVFRNGCIEGCDTSLLGAWPGPEKMISGEVAEYRLMEFLDRSVEILKKLKCEPPFFVALSLLNVRGYGMRVDNNPHGSSGSQISRDHLLAPETFVESYDFVSAEVLRESFYMIWNACGWQRSINYKEDHTLKTAHDRVRG